MWSRKVQGALWPLRGSKSGQESHVATASPFILGIMWGNKGFCMWRGIRKFVEKVGCIQELHVEGGEGMGERVGHQIMCGECEG